MKEKSLINFSEFINLLNKKILLKKEKNTKIQIMYRGTRNSVREEKMLDIGSFQSFKKY